MTTRVSSFVSGTGSTRHTVIGTLRRFAFRRLASIRTVILFRRRTSVFARKSTPRSPFWKSPHSEKQRSQNNPSRRNKTWNAFFFSSSLSLCRNSFSSVVVGLCGLSSISSRSPSLERERQLRCPSAVSFLERVSLLAWLSKFRKRVRHRPSSVSGNLSCQGTETNVR